MIIKDVSPMKNCKNIGESYGTICVKCNKCGKFTSGPKNDNDVESFPTNYGKIKNMSIDEMADFLTIINHSPFADNTLFIGGRGMLDDHNAIVAWLKSEAK